MIEVSYEITETGEQGTMAFYVFGASNANWANRSKLWSQGESPSPPSTAEKTAADYPAAIQEFLKVIT